MTADQPTKIKDQITLRFSDTLELTGDLYKTTYTDGNDAVLLITDEGEETVSVNLMAHAYVPEIGAVFVKNDLKHLAQSLAEATGGSIGRTVAYGPFDATATEVFLGA